MTHIQKQLTETYENSGYSAALDFWKENSERIEKLSKNEVSFLKTIMSRYCLINNDSKNIHNFSSDKNIFNSNASSIKKRLLEKYEEEGYEKLLSFWKENSKSMMLFSEKEILALKNIISRFCLINKDEKMAKAIFNDSLSSREDFVLIVRIGCVSDFYICKYPVTQDIYEEIMGENPSYFKGKKRPVENISWYDAIYFCNKLSKKDGLEPVYFVNDETDVDKWNYQIHQNTEINEKILQKNSANGYRLPTESEWEYAARGGKYHNFSGADKIRGVGWHEGNSNDETHEVGQKNANAFGLYDMSGNVWEWCSSGNCRGGSYYTYADNCQITSSKNEDYKFRNTDLGFRIVRNLNNENISSDDFTVLKDLSDNHSYNPFVSLRVKSSTSYSSSYSGGKNNNLVSGFNDEKDDSLRINLEKLEGVDNGLIIYLNGYIDHYNAQFFQKRIQKVVEAGFFNLVFNCESLNYVSSTGVGSFTSVLKIIKPKGGDIVLLEIQPKVYEVFQLLGFSQFFNIKNSMADAKVFFNFNDPITNSVFPKIFSCPVCSKRLKATKAGRFRCSECKSILAIDQQGQVFLG